VQHSDGGKSRWEWRSEEQKTKVFNWFVKLLGLLLLDDFGLAALVWGRLERQNTWKRCCIYVCIYLTLFVYLFDFICLFI